jgi:transposase-like protein
MGNETHRARLGEKETHRMKKKTTERKHLSTPPEVAIPDWSDMEAWVRGKIRELLQGLLEAEVTELLGRNKSERRAAVDGEIGYRNGYGKPRKLTLGAGTITLQRPRVRGLEERLVSRVLPLFVRRTQGVTDLIPELYLHGLAQGDFDLALRGLLGEGAPLSASTVGRLKAKWQVEWEEWNQRSLADLEVVYLWVDGIYVKAGLEKSKAALLVVLGALSDGRKVVLAVRPGHRESTESWSAVLRDLQARGLNTPRLVVGDGHLGIWGAWRNVYPEVAEQRCWNHRIVNILDTLPKNAQAQALMYLKVIPYALTRAEALRLRQAFQTWCRRHGHTLAAQRIEEDWDRMVAFYDFPKEHWRHLRTTNPIESPFAALRLRTDAAKRYKSVANATAIMWKLLLVAERRFRRLNAPERMNDVFRGAKYQDGIQLSKATRSHAA